MSLCDIILYMKKVLLIEDDEFIEGLEARKMIASGFEVISAQSGEEAIKKIQEPGIDLILLDLELPNYSGFDILKEIKKSEKTNKIPVIIFSNIATDENRKKAKEMGATEFLVKSSLSLTELIEEINKLI